MKPKKAKEHRKFDAAVRKILSVSHNELKRREAEWKNRRKGQKALASESASHDADA